MTKDPIRQLAEQIMEMQREICKWRGRCDAWQITDGSWVSGRDLIAYDHMDGTLTVLESDRLEFSKRLFPYTFVCSYETRRDDPDMRERYPLDQWMFHENNE